MDYNQALEKLAQYDQTHLLEYYGELDDNRQKELLKQIEETDFSVVKNLKHQESGAERGTITPIVSMEIDEIEKNRSHFEALGLDAIKQQKVGAVLLAGGMGTRLGSDEPKGVYNIGLTKDLYIFECLINNLLEVVKKADAWVPLFIMTSDKNHERTVSFFKEHDFFGYKEDLVWFFKQEMAPAVNFEGKVLLETKSKISTSPNGNGGWFVSLARNGLVDKIHEIGIEWLNIFAVDNVLQKIADPVFIGASIERAVEVGAKVVRKATPDEKVGVMCLEDGRPSIVEYYELTEQMRDERNEKGEYAYNFGVILNYLFSVSALERIMSRKLCLHIVEKKINCLDEKGNEIKPQEPNGYKFEQLVLDMIHELESCLPFEVVREKEFAPIKNATGVDSVETARELLKENGIAL
ncbi:MAG: UDPGP type 1 family protein [Lachnospiraceae bacterium]|nr:UDPGP type 1 family protein [Lachnospiraceae bacterium]